MDRHLIIAVHGIGEQKPGETVDAIVGAATTRFPDQQRTPVTVERDEIELAERGFRTVEPEKATRENRYPDLFPVHLRRVRKADDPSSKDEALFAEVYWADKSPAPKGPFWTMFDLLKVILGLGYIAMENVESNRGRFSIGLVHVFTWVFYGLVAPLNAVLLIGAAVLMLDLTSITIAGPKVLAALFLHGGLTMLIGAFVWFNVARTYLVRIFGRGLTVLGAVIILIALSRIAAPELSTGLCGGDGETLTPRDNLGCFVGLTIDVLGAVWFVTVLLALLAFVPACFGKEKKVFVEYRPSRLIRALRRHIENKAARDGPENKFRTKARREIDRAENRLHKGIGRQAKVAFWSDWSHYHPDRVPDAPEPIYTDDLSQSHPGHRAIFASVCAAMVVFWMVFSSSFWLLFSNTFERLTTKATHPHRETTFLGSIFEAHLLDALSTLAITTCAFIFLVISAACLVGLRKWKAEALYTEPEWLSRMILNIVLQVVLFFALVSILFVILYLFFIDPKTWTVMNDRVELLSAFSVDVWLVPVLEWTTPVVRPISENPEWAIGLLALIGVLIYNFSDYISGGLGIVRDIVVYAVQSHCKWLGTTKERRKNFTERNEINARFRRVLHYALETFKPTRITVISHSQGTVISTQMLQDRGDGSKIVEERFDVHALLEKNDAPPLTLVTMGSPVTHIYRRYFKEFFQVSRSNMPIDRAGNKTKWFNIHRADDFVGTRIGDTPEDDDDLAKNLVVPAGGHSGYFVDYFVWKQMYETVKFKLFA